ncbi:hypothetical protein DACRYDRAFT_112273 [Dacryopinax primogenitus]|uniref:Sld7 C-terminal domain-containing protein n=1 Tax=Dacryopinax primogenitus (strain DJM 731) TaxID=1858805 RepID=M5FPA7_DACPD|nr:uncharacterized protein DACRYDRAFT_112273 [Dacryopinax primogenitus]EJT96933.1 hypothetical protein DACRYDRAFT_112273 [Dacryopinax primogenitus]
MAPSHRLLWRGALSHPFTQLDGVAFIAHLPQSTESPSTTPTHSKLGALDTPTALALETLRGRPSLPVLGTWKGEVDVEQGIRIHINPSCHLTVAYFTRLFSTPPLSPTSQHTPCLRISLSSCTPSAEDELLLFPSPLPSGNIEILVARPRPSLPKAKRLVPRPDDPLPRRIQDLRGLDLQERGIKRTSSNGPEALDDVFSATAKRRRISDEPPTKPDRPFERRKSGKLDKLGKENLDQEADRSMPPPLVPPNSEPSSTEEQNKALIKKHIVTSLANAGCGRAHADFKDCFSIVNRGVSFALVRFFLSVLQQPLKSEKRKHLKRRKLDRDEVVRLVGAHVGMYFVPDSPVKPSRTSRPRETLERAGSEEVIWA